MQGETMVSETVLGVLFCFFLPLAVAARFWQWYTYKRGQKTRFKQCKASKTMTDALLPLNCTWWFVGNVVDNSVDSTLDRVGDSRTDLL